MNITNSVVNHTYRQSSNFWESDLLLQDVLHALPVSALLWVQPYLHELGDTAAQNMDAWSQNADKYPPTLRTRNQWGETINDIQFHPDYWQLLQTALRSRMFHLKWQPDLRKQFSGSFHQMSFALGFLYAMSESGQYCPLCMTDGAARLIDRYCPPDIQERLLPRIYTLDYTQFATGAMFLTEKSGGSDVGRNLVSATLLPNGKYALNGEKWFCSNANADIIFVLARTQPHIHGTKGLSIFLVEKYLEDGTPNPMNFVRLKDKLGVRSMASAEIILTNTIGTLVGNEMQGFAIMTDMINLSRLYNAVAAVSAARRALTEAYQFLQHRTSFGKRAADHPLVRFKLHELATLYIADFYLLWRTICALDAAEETPSAASPLRLLTPMLKRCTAQNAVYIIRESIELMGGIAYIEDSIMPKLFRDANVLPIWEGAGNIMVLDMLRVALKSPDTVRALVSEVTHSPTQLHLLQQFEALATMPPDEQEIAALHFFNTLEKHIKIKTLKNYEHTHNTNWIQPTIEQLERNEALHTAPTPDSIEKIMAWLY